MLLGRQQGDGSTLTCSFSSLSSAPVPSTTHAAWTAFNISTTSVLERRGRTAPSDRSHAYAKEEMGSTDRAGEVSDVCSKRERTKPPSGAHLVKRLESFVHRLSSQMSEPTLVRGLPDWARDHVGCGWVRRVKSGLRWS